MSRPVPVISWMAHHVCVICGNKWRMSDSDVPNRTDFTVWCDNNHEMWYFTEVEFLEYAIRIDGREFTVRWNCHCMVGDCLGKNVIWEHQDYDDADQSERMWIFESLPYGASIEQIREIINREPSEIRS